MVSGMTHHRQLSIRQAQVLSLLVRGMTNKEIARALHIAEGTTKSTRLRCCARWAFATARKPPPQPRTS